MRNERINNAFENDYLRYVSRECDRRRLTKTGAAKFEEIYQNLGEQNQATALEEMPRKTGALRAIGKVATSVAACMALLVTLNIMNPALAEGLPVIGGMFKSINGAFKTVNATTKSPVGTNIDSYEPQEKQLAMAATGETEYNIEITEAYSDGEYAHAAMKMTTPAGVSGDIAHFFATGNCLIDGQESENALFFDGGIARFHESDEEGVYIGTVSTKLPVSKATGESIDLVINIEQFYLSHRDVNKDYEIQQENGYGETGDSYLSGLEADISPFTGEVNITVDTSHNKSFDVEAGEEGYKIYHVESSPSITYVTADIPYIEKPSYDNMDVLTAPINALYTQSGVEIMRNYNKDGEYVFGYDRAHEEAPEMEPTSLAFDGVPMGTTELIFRWYEDYDYEKVLAEYTIDLVSKTARTTKSYADESSPLYQYNPAMFAYGNWSLLKYETWYEEFEKEFPQKQGEMTEEEKNQAENERDEKQREFYHKKFDELAEWQNDFALESLWLNNTTGNKYVDLRIYKRNGYKDVEVQVLAGDRKIASYNSFDGTEFTDYAVKTGYFDERDEWFAGGEGDKIPYYSLRFGYKDGDVSAADKELTVKVVDRATGDELMNITVEMEYLWGVR